MTMTTITREIAAAHAAKFLTRTATAEVFGTSRRTLGRWIEKVEAERRAKAQAKLDAKFTGKVSRRRVTMIIVK